MSILFLLPILYLVVNVSYYLFFSVASLFIPVVKRRRANHVKKDIAVIIPAYKENEVILDSAQKALNHNYPKDKYRVYVLADQLIPEVAEKLREMDLDVIDINFEQSSKAKAINYALGRIPVHDITVVLDADNVMTPNFLKEVNRQYNNGSLAIQGQRIAKNVENNMALLDAVSEGINNHIFRKGHQVVGLSSALIGSGMAFDSQLFKRQMKDIDALGGFDKQLELSLLKDRVKINYLPEAKVLDEKVSDQHSFGMQRTRWIAAQIRFGLKSFVDALHQLLLKGNIDYFDKSLQFLLLPRLILLGTLCLATMTSILLNSDLIVVHFSLLAGCMGALLIATPRTFFTIRFFRSIMSLPMLFIRMLYAITGYKKAANNFLHTVHKKPVQG